MLCLESHDYPEIRQGVADLCADFPADYWRKLDREMAYPTNFVQALSQAGYLAALIPQEYGGSGLPLSGAAAILEEVQRAGCNGAACHAQMYIMGALLRHGSEAQKNAYLPMIASGELRADTNPDDFVRALVGVFHTTAIPGWEQSARRLVNILIAGSRPTK